MGGHLVTYTNFSGKGEIRYQNLVTGADAAIPNAGHRDELSDVSGTTIAFRRVFIDGSTTRAIMAFDTATGEPPVELDPQPGVQRASPAVGGRTVAWVEFAPGSLQISEVVVYDLDTRVAMRLSNDGGKINTNPSVSPDGSVVTWTKCLGNGTHCDIYVASKAGEAWITTQLTGAEGEEVLPDTNGEIVVYTSTGAGGEWHIWWKKMDGTQAQKLDLPGYRPNISGNLISFEHDAPGSHTDLWMYDLATDTLYQLTETPAVDEHLSDISIGSDGTVWVVWAQYDGLVLGDADILGTSFRLESNRPPDCSGVSPSARRLWPPDHKLQPVSLGGATDPDDDPVTLTVTAVIQDEPVDGVDDGATAPDAQLGTTLDHVLVRRERSGAGDGRVYRIQFTVTDSSQASCTGVVTVEVPLVQNGATVDSGYVHDSLSQ